MWAKPASRVRIPPTPPARHANGPLGAHFACSVDCLNKAESKLALSAGSASTRWWRAAGPGVQVAECDPSFGQVVWGQFQRNVVPCKDADVVLAHLPRGIRNHLMPIVERDAITRVGQDFVDLAAHFNQFFFGHCLWSCPQAASQQRPAEIKTSTRTVRARSRPPISAVGRMQPRSPSSESLSNFAGSS